MSKNKNSFEDNFLSMVDDEQVQNDNNNDKNIENNDENNSKSNSNQDTPMVTSDSQDSLKNDFEVFDIEPKTLSWYVKTSLNDIDSEIEMQFPKNKLSKINSRKKHRDIYSGVTWSVRKKIDVLVDTLTKVSGMNKYEIIDLILLTGLRNLDLED